MGAAMKSTSKKAHSVKGFSLIEVMIAMVLLLVGLGAILGMFSVAVGDNANQGEGGTRVTEYAQDKMEQLMALSFADGATDTTVYPPATTGGTGLGGNLAASTSVGGVTAGSPVTGYVDYLSSTGALLTSASGALYVRQWSITMNAAQTLKSITVYVRALKALGPGVAPSVTLICFKTKTT
jgi:prepilin-type N-terminal cleavage/methylation domain-containing protein